MMKLAVFFAFFSVAFATSLRSYQGSPQDPVSFLQKNDINVELAGGAATSASGDQAVGSAADSNSGAVGAKGLDNAFGFAGPGLALGIGQGNGPDATPGLGSIFNIFN